MGLRLTHEEYAEFCGAIYGPELEAEVRSWLEQPEHPAEPGWFNEEWDDFRNLIVHAYIAISERYANEYAQKYPQLADEVAKIRADPEGTLAFVRPMLRSAMEEE